MMDAEERPTAYPTADPNIGTLFVRLGAQQLPGISGPEGLHMPLSLFRECHRHLGVSRLALEEQLLPLRAASRKSVTLADFIRILATIAAQEYPHEGDGALCSSNKHSAQHPAPPTSSTSPAASALVPKPPAGPAQATSTRTWSPALQRFQELLQRDEQQQQRQGYRWLNDDGRCVERNEVDETAGDDWGVASLARLALDEMDRLAQREEPPAERPRARSPSTKRRRAAAPRLVVPAPLPRVALLAQRIRQPKEPAPTQGTSRRRRGRRTRAEKLTLAAARLQSEDLRRLYSDSEACVVEVPPCSLVLSASQRLALGRFHRHRMIAACIVVQAFVTDQLQRRSIVQAVAARILQRVGRGFARVRVILGRLLRRGSVRTLLFRSGAILAQDRLHPQATRGCPACYVHPVHRITPISAQQRLEVHESQTGTNDLGESAGPADTPRTSGRVPKQHEEPSSARASRPSTAQGTSGKAIPRPPSTAKAAASPIRKIAQRRAAQLALQERAAKAIQRFCSLLLCRFRYQRAQRAVLEAIRREERRLDTNLVLALLRWRASQRRRNQVLRVATRKAACAVIQRAFRCHRARRICRRRSTLAQQCVAHRVYAEQFQSAALTAATFWRRRIAARAVANRQRLLSMHSESRVRKEKQADAAATLARFVRYVRARATFLASRRAVALRTASRDALEARHYAVTLIATVMRGALARRRLVKVQRRAAAWRQRAVNAERIAASVDFVQACLHAFSSRQLHVALKQKSAHAAALEVQLIARGWLQRRRFRKLREEVRQHCIEHRIARERDTDAGLVLQCAIRVGLACDSVRARFASRVVRAAVRVALRTARNSVKVASF